MAFTDPALHVHDLAHAAAQVGLNTAATFTNFSPPPSWLATLGYSERVTLLILSAPP